MYRWTPDRIQAAAARYEHRSDFRAGDRLAYNAAQRWGLLDAVCAHMDRKPHPIDWTPQRILVEALKFDHRGEFKKGALPAYRAAHRLRILDDVCRHMEPLRRRPRHPNQWQVTRERVAPSRGLVESAIEDGTATYSDQWHAAAAKPVRHSTERATAARRSCEAFARNLP